MCPICHKSNHVNTLRLLSQDQVKIGAWSCGDCRHAWRTELWQKSDPIKFFGDASYTRIENAKKLDATKEILFKAYLQLANKVRSQKPRLMVDFGCSYGTVLQLFKENDWNVMGIEISPTAQNTLNNQNLPWAPRLEDSGLELASVDVVIMADCIYYLPDPISTLRTIRTYMKPEGMLLLRQPTRGGLVRLLLKVSKEKSLTSGLWLDHIHLFSRKSTELTLKQAGFVDTNILREKKFRRSLKGEIIHRLLHIADQLTFGRFDLTASWTVTTKVPKK